MPINSIHILLVDDDNIDIMAFKRAIKQSSIASTIADFNYADDALESLGLAQYDCAFIDYQLPGLDGLELLKRIKARKPELPVCVLTSQGDEKLAVQMMKHGAHDYLTKDEVTPENLRKVFHSINRHLNLKREKLAAEKLAKEKDDFIKKISLSSPNLIYVNDLENGRNAFYSEQSAKVLGYTTPRNRFFR